MAADRVRSDQLRVSDAERAEVAEQLKQHYGDGRLDPSEFDERLGQAMRAKTRADLAGLLGDLPGQAAKRPTRRHSLWALAWVVVAAVIALNALVWTVSMPHLGFVALIVVGALVWSHRAGRRRALESERRG